jgi:hypothetical protein
VECVGYINLARGRDQWRDVVNTIIYLRIPQESENLFTA